MRGVQSLSWSLLGPHGHPAQSQGHTRCSGSFYRMNHLPVFSLFNPTLLFIVSFFSFGFSYKCPDPSFPALTGDLSFLSSHTVALGQSCGHPVPLPCRLLLTSSLLCHLATPFLDDWPDGFARKLEVLSQKFQFGAVTTTNFLF